MAETRTINLEIKDNVKSLKAQYKEAVQEVQRLAETYGATSKEAAEAAKRAAELKDQIEDTNDAIAAFKGEGVFTATGKALGSVASGFSAVEGAVALTGVESEKLQETMVRLQAAMALTQGLEGLEDAGRAFGTLKTRILDFGQTALTTFKGMSTASKAFAVTGVGLIITAVGVLMANMDKLKQTFFGVTEVQEAQKEATISGAKAMSEATMTVNEVGLAFEQAKKGVISKEQALKTYNDKLGATLGTTDDLNEAEKIYRENSGKYIKAVQARAIAQALAQKAAEKLAEAETAAMENNLTVADNALSSARLVFGQITGLGGSLQDQQDAINAKQTQRTKEVQDRAKQAFSQLNQLSETYLKDAMGIESELASGKEKIEKKSLKQTKINTEKAINLRRQITDEQVKAIEDENQRQQTQTIIEANRRIQDIKATKASKKQKAQLIKEIEQNLVKDLDKLDQEYYDKKQAEEKARIAEEEQIRKEQYDAFVKAEKEKFDLEDEQFLMLQKLRNSAKDQEILEKQLEYEKLFEQAKGNAELELALEEQLRKDIAAISKKYATEETEEQQKKTKAIKENFELSKEYAQQTTDFFKKQSDERIALIDKEISAAEKQAEIYRELAANGNINAEQSLAEQERIIAESNQRKEREMKRQQRMELANTIYQTYAGHAAQDPKTALANTIRDASLLQAFISTLPMFYDGTEDTGAGGGVDGKGGFHAVLHPHERVIPKSLNDQIGSLTNEQLTRLATDYQNGRLIGKDTAHSSLELALLVNKLDTLTEVIKHKPETNIQLGEITQSAMEIVQSTKQGNTTVYNRFKVRK